MKFRIPLLSSLWSFVKKNPSLNAVDLTENPNGDTPAWWGLFLMGEEQSRFFKIGQMVICVDRFNNEWHITSHKEGEQPFKNFAAHASNQICIKPILPDRPLLSTLEVPIYVPTRESVLLYVCSPLHIQLEVGKPLIPIDEIPMDNLADTWFGKNTLEGELCYANTTHCSSHVEDFLEDNGSTHAIVPISISNRSKETLLIDSLKIPLPHLSLYTDVNQCLWTEQLNFQFDDIHRVIDLPVVKSLPKPLKEIQLITKPRLSTKQGLKNLFNPFKGK